MERGDSTPAGTTAPAAATAAGGDAAPTYPAPPSAFLIGLNFAAVYVLWGSTYLAIRFGLDDLPPALMAGTRFTVAGAILLVYLMARRRPMPPRDMLLPMAVIGILMLFFGNGLVTWSELSVPSGMAAVIVANLPLVVAAIEAMRRDGERLSAFGIAGIVVGSIGMLVLMWPKLGTIRGRGLGDFGGELALLGANVCWAAGSIYSRHRLRGVAPLVAVAFEMLFGGAALLALGGLLGEAPRYHMTARAGLALGWLIVAGSLCGYSAYIWLIHHVPPAKVSTYAYVNPVIAVFLGWLLLGEPLDWRLAAGTAIILGGVAVVNAARIATKG